MEVHQAQSEGEDPHEILVGPCGEAPLRELRSRLGGAAAHAIPTRDGARAPPAISKAKPLAS
jgi:hypothetical protein